MDKILVKTFPPTVSTQPANVSLAKGLGSDSKLALGTTVEAPKSVNKLLASDLPVIAETLYPNSLSKTVAIDPTPPVAPETRMSPCSGVIPSKR